MNASSERTLTAIYCDDIRNEVGNKMSFMGCYQNELYVQSAPIGLSKLCVYATLLTPIERPFRAVTFRVLLDDASEIAVLEMPEEGLQQIFVPFNGSATRYSINSAIVFSPYVVEKPSALRIVVDTDEGRIYGPQLLIKIASSGSTESPTPAPAKSAKSKASGTRKKKSATPSA